MNMSSSDSRRPRHTLSVARRTKEPFLKLLGLLLLIYATLGRTGAHIGLSLGLGTGIYIGDLVFLLGLATMIVEGSYDRFFALPVAWPWFLFCVWNAAQTLPYISEYGLVALRDATLWGYSLFAVIISSQLLARPSRFVILLSQFARFSRAFVFFVLVMMPVSIFFPKGALGFAPPVVTEFADNLIGTIGFAACGLVAVPNAWWWAAFIDVFIIGCLGRGALLGSLAAAAVIRLFYPWSLRLSVRAVGVVAGVSLMLCAALMLNLDLGSVNGRAIGPNELLENIAGSFGDTHYKPLEGSLDWRLKMWSAIIDYTVFGSSFWTGKGYGINLQDDARLQVGSRSDPSRSPENSHLDFLARSGVPGFFLWVVLQSTWAVGTLRVLLFARRTRRRRTRGIMTFLLAYWTVSMIHTGTGPILEGPQGAIWFWTIFGGGAAAARMVRRDGDFFERMDFHTAGATSRRAAVSALRSLRQGT